MVNDPYTRAFVYKQKRKMSFLFNFSDPRADKDKDDKKPVSQSAVISENIQDCEEIFEADPAVLKDMVSNLAVITYSLSNGLCVKCLDSQQVEDQIKDNKSRQSSGTCIAAMSHSDLIPNVYEGGMKVWECSVDLVEYLDVQCVDFKDKTVLELGCGAGLPGISAVIKGARAVHFADYNSEVIDSYTIPNVHLNKRPKCKCRYFSGDWTLLKDKLLSEHIKYDIILTAETIYKPENYRKLSSIFQHCLSDEGTIYLSAKSNYFGVGGGVCDFVDFMTKEELFNVEICHTIDEAVPRQILKINWKSP